MTLVIAIACIDGVIVASDSQSTEMTGNIRYDVEKVFELTGHSAAGLSGQGQIIREVRRELEGARALLESSETSPDMDQSLVSLVRPILTKHYDNHIRGVPGVPPASPASSILAGGRTAHGRNWIIEVDPTCQYTHYEELGFHAIGSAAGFAQLANALLRHFTVKERPLQHGRLIAYRVMRAAVDTSAYGVGGPIQMWEATSAGVTRLSGDEVRQAEADVGGWEQVERDALDQFMSPPPSEETEDQLPAEIPPESQ